MLGWALTFFIIAVIAAVMGFGGIAAGAAGIAKILFFIFLVLFVLALVARSKRTPADLISSAGRQLKALPKRRTRVRPFSNVFALSDDMLRRFADDTDRDSPLY